MNPIEWLIVGAAWEIWNGPRRFVSGKVLVAALRVMSEGAVRGG